MKLIFDKYIISINLNIKNIIFYKISLTAKKNSFINKKSMNKKILICSPEAKILHRDLADSKFYEYMSKNFDVD